MVKSPKQFLEDQAGKGFEVLPVPTSNQESLKAYVGTVLRRKRDGTDEKWNFLAQFRPDSDAISLQLEEETLFDGLVSSKTDLGGYSEAFEGDANGEELAKIQVRNLYSVGYANPKNIPYNKLGRYPLDPQYEYFFISRLVVGEITENRFQKYSGKGDIKGLAFGANGGTYVEREGTKMSKFVHFLREPLELIQPSEAGSSTELSKLADEARRGELDPNAIKQFQEEMGKESPRTVFEHSTKDVIIVPPPPLLPPPLSKMEKVQWKENVWPVRQSSPETCWLAATAILRSWKKGTYTSEEQIRTSLNDDWQSLLGSEDSTRLVRSHKVPFLGDVSLDYHAPAGFTPDGVARLLDEKGPLWFTIEHEDGGRHAIVLTGLFLDAGNGKYWVSFIDPEDGQLHSMSFSRFYQKYEEIAYKANEEGVVAAQSEAELDLQVIFNALEAR